MTSGEEKAARLIREGSRITVLTGAGMSTPSGIPDFRSSGGLYSDPQNSNVFDLDSFRRDPSAFYRFAREFYPMVRDAFPNPAHRVLAKWEAAGKDVRIATQNIDDLHQRAGSTKVFPVHGTILTSTCQSCGRRTESKGLLAEVMEGRVPRCLCEGVFKPDITFFGEMLPEKPWEDATHAMALADVVLVIGTSLVVFPAASLPSHRNSDASLVIVNREATFADGDADVVLHGDVAEVLTALDARL